MRAEQALERGLQELGWLPGKTIRVEYRYADGKQTRLDQLASDLVRRGVDVIVAWSGLTLLIQDLRPKQLQLLKQVVPQLSRLAIKHRLPAIYWLRGYTEAGGLMSYGADLIEVHRRSAFSVHRILQGARPADLPVEEPTRLVLVLNLKTARAIGLTFPSDVRACADEILQCVARLPSAVVSG